MPCILNAANEVAVDAFLQEKISFLQISDLIERSMESMDFIAHPSYEDLKLSDMETRKKAVDFFKINF